MMLLMMMLLLLLLLLLIYLMDCLASPQQLEQSFGVGGDHPCC